MVPWEYLFLLMHRAALSEWCTPWMVSLFPSQKPVLFSLLLSTVSLLLSTVSMARTMSKGLPMSWTVDDLSLMEIESVVIHAPKLQVNSKTVHRILSEVGNSFPYHSIWLAFMFLKMYTLTPFLVLMCPWFWWGTKVIAEKEDEHQEKKRILSRKHTTDGEEMGCGFEPQVWQTDSEIILNYFTSLTFSYLPCKTKYMCAMFLSKY